MLYPTHRNFGKLFTIAAVPVAAGTGIFPAVPHYYNISGGLAMYALNCLPLLMAGLVAFKGGTWGAGYPDIDSDSSIPTANNRWLHFIFKLCGVKHRGRFSHSLLSITLTFAFIFLFASKGLPQLLGFLKAQYYTTADTVLYLTAALACIQLLKVWVFFAYVGAVSHWIGDMLTTEGAYVLWERKIRMFPLKIFKTGSSWEMFWRFLTGKTYVLVLAYAVFFLIWQVNFFGVLANLF